MNRRHFIKGLLAAGAAPLLPGCFSASAYRANGKIRLAAIGVGQQAWYDMQEFMKCADICEFVALCDTDMGSKETLDAIAAHPNLPRYRDFRKMFDEMADEIDAVVIAIPDFSHFPAAMHAMKLGKAVFVEKPLAHTYEECELLVAAAKKYGVVTQMGNQGHSSEKYHQFKEYVEKGVVKDVERVVVHMNYPRRWHKYSGNIFRYPDAMDIPNTLDWNSWLTTAQYHNYSDEYVRGEWRCWFDFGNGCLGDWGAHLMDCVHEFILKGDLPTKIELNKCEGWNQFVFPCATTMAFTFPKNEKHDAMRLEWYDGATNFPTLPKGFVYATPDGIPQNSANVGEDQVKLFPGKEMYCRDGMIWQSLSHKHPLHIVGDYNAKLPDYPAETETHYRNFLLAIKGEQKARSPFEIAAPLSQIFCLGCIAQRVNRGFKFDPKKGTILGDEYANAFLKGPAPRKGWEEYYRV